MFVVVVCNAVTLYLLRVYDTLHMGSGTVDEGRKKRMLVSAVGRGRWGRTAEREKDSWSIKGWMLSAVLSTYYSHRLPYIIYPPFSPWKSVAP